MFNVYRKEFDFGGKKVTLETGKIARQADGAVMATMGGTTVLCTVVGSRSIKEGQDLTSRLIDRPIRPLFPETFLNEVQVIATVVSHDLENPADIVAMIGARPL
jgi:polyribonucleotide nucleotidyltransferase